jgi:pimeloyl-ACP methyl ester carboxylesterase
MTSEIVHTSDGRELCVCQWGPEDGMPVFVLHGTPGSRYLRHVQGEYERKAVRAITYDRPGYGLSTRRAGRTVADSAADVAAIANHLGLDKFRVAGISGGGPSALAAAAAMPDRVTRCATIKGSGPHDAPDLDPFEGMSAEELGEWACAKEGEVCLAGRFYEESLTWAESMTDEIPGPIGQMLAEAFLEGLRTPWGLVDDYSSQLRPWGFDVGDVVCPTKVMIARGDTSCPPAHGYWLVDHLPAGEAFVVEGGHFGPQDEEEEALLGWLASGR